MANSNNFHENEESLTTRDLVLLYKNIDIGTQLMSNANETKNINPNQHVETIVYDADPDTDSDLSEICSNEDLCNVFTINNERIDLLNNNSSLDNVLCHKLGDIKLQSSMSAEYERHFLFKDPYIKEQLKNLHLMASSTETNTVLPASLLDYICCKRLEDNYNFYMDGIIRYVKHTIEQLKRISNGDYLTDKAKEKWRQEVKKFDKSDKNDAKVLAVSTSIPLHIERKVSGLTSTWDDIVHSEVDIRSLSKILEKKIIVQIPKLLHGSFKLFSKCYADNLIISCKKQEESVIVKKQNESSINVVVDLQRSGSGHVISNINSIVILQSAPPLEPPFIKEVLALPYTETKNTQSTFDNVDNSEDLTNVNVTEMDFHKQKFDPVECSLSKTLYAETSDTESEINDSTTGYPNSDNYCQHSQPYQSNRDSNEFTNDLRNILSSSRVVNTVQRETTYMTAPDDLQLAMRRLNLHDSLPEENEDMLLGTNKKKSPTRLRIKSPYENKSFILEEKKRKKLLEIREKREKKKMAMTENCKITKHKYGKNAILPQASSSVTKLSISNKSFYNSIYGNSMNDTKQSNTKGRKGYKKNVAIEIPAEDSEVDFNDALSTPDKNNKKYINRSYYLDEAITEIMFVEKAEETKDIEATAVSPDSCKKLNLISQFMNPSVPKISISTSKLSKGATVAPHNSLERDTKQYAGNDSHKNLSSCESKLKITREDTKTNVQIQSNNDPKAVTASCRQNIDKIYNLMNRFRKPHVNEKKSSTKLASNMFDKISDKNNMTSGHESSIVQGSDSGTSLKHHLTSSNPSNFSFGKPDILKPKMNNRTTETLCSVVPKVIISTKSHIPKPETKQDRMKCIVSPMKSVPDNPLKAISQLLHEFDNVQRTRQKTVETKINKKVEVVEGKSNVRVNQLKRNTRPEQPTKQEYLESQDKTKTSRKVKQLETSTASYRIDEDKNDKINKKKLTDIIDEVKEARGEAVRGPSKISRLQVLAQPKKIYVQAHSEEYQIRYGRNLMADRLQRLANASVYSSDRPTGSGRSRSKQRRSEGTIHNTVKQSSPPVPPLERSGKLKRSTSSSPERKARATSLESPYKQNTADVSETLSKRMVAVESYVKSHYGRAGGTSSSRSLGARVTRIPLLPKDIELASVPSTYSVQASTVLGNKLHNIINKMLNSKPGEPVLASLMEHNEPDSKNSIENTENASLVENLSQGEPLSEIDVVDILEDKNIVTLMENITHDINQEDKTKQNICTKENLSNLEKVQINSSTELELERALYRKLSMGTFQKKLRIKNLTLTPKHSMQQTVILQSGDVGSLFDKSATSQDLKLTSTKSESMTDFKIVPVLSNTCIDWRFGKFPMQVATVGYVFPKYEPVQHVSNTNIKVISNDMINNIDIKSDKTIQCFKGGQVALQLEQSVQASIAELLVKSSKNELINKSKIMSDEEASVHVTTVKTFQENDQHWDTDSHTSKNDEIIQSTISNKDFQNIFETNNEIDINDSSNKNTMQLQPQDVNYTTSLDMLVGLLNEIHKITCQKNTNNKNNIEEAENKDLETMLNNAVLQENKDNIEQVMSNASVEKEKEIIHQSSTHACKLSDCSEQFQTEQKLVVTSQINSGQTDVLYLDKEVNVNELNQVNAFTDVPSQLILDTVNHSTSVTKSLAGVLSEPSSHSIFFDSNYSKSHSLCSESLHHAYENTAELHQLLSMDCTKESIIVYQNKKEFTKHKKNNDANLDIELNKKKSHFTMISNNRKTYGAAEFDAIMKMKRDILVTIYSILVFVVFAALSFPEVLYRV